MWLTLAKNVVSRLVQIPIDSFPSDTRGCRVYVHRVPLSVHKEREEARCSYMCRFFKTMIISLFSVMI